MSRLVEFLLCIGDPIKRIQYKNAFRLVIVILLITLISSNPNSSLTKYKQPSNNFDSFDMAEISDLPNTSITINILGTMFGNQIEAKLDYGFRYDNTSSLIYGIGFSQQYLTIENSIIFTQASGLGYDEMREYPFAYTDSGMITDYWLNHTANWISRRKYAAWTSLNTIGLYLGPISEENMTHLTKVGDIIEFENLTIYFEDGTSFLCGPRVITVGVNFTQQNGEWEVEYLIDSSDSQHTLIQESEMTIYLSKSDPISTPFIGGVSVAFVILIILSLEWYRRRLPKSLSSTSRIELS